MKVKGPTDLGSLHESLSGDGVGARVQLQASRRSEKVTRQKKFKKRVRDRAAKTGESYASARRREDEHARLIEEMEKAPLTETQEAQLEREERNRQWMKDNPGLKIVALTLTHNEHGTPTIHVTGPELTSMQITQPPDVYVEAIRHAYQDNEWIKNPKDDLGDWAKCSTDPALSNAAELPEGTFYDSFADMVKAMEELDDTVLPIDYPDHGLVGFMEMKAKKSHWIHISKLRSNLAAGEIWDLMKTPQGRREVAHRFNVKQDETLAAVLAAKEGWKEASALPTNPDPMEVDEITGVVLADGFSHVEKFNIRVEGVVMQSRSLAEARECMKGLPSFRAEHRIWRLKEGLMAWLWNAPVITTRDIAEDEIRFLGRNPEGKWVRQSVRVNRPNGEEVSD